MTRHCDDFQPYMPPAVRNAYDVVQLWEENQQLKYELREAEKYRQLYFDHLNESIAAGEREIGNWLKLMLSGRLTYEPFDKAAP